MIETTATVRVAEGLHTRPAAHIAKLAKSFDCSVELVCRGAAANAKSSVKLMLLGVKEGEEVTLRADGRDESAALRQLLHYLQNPEPEPDEAHAAPSATAAVPVDVLGSCGRDEPGLLRGITGSPGTALGPAYAYAPATPTVTRQVILAAEVPDELARFRRAVAEVAQSLDHLIQSAQGEQDRAILQALAEVAQDEEYVGAIVRGIEACGDAAAMTLQAGESLAGRFAAMPDGYMRARADDIRGVTRQLACALLGQTLPDLAAIAQPSVVVAHDLSASEFARLPLDKTLALVCTGGSATSHVAIMARTYGIPAVLGVPMTDQDFARLRVVAVDGQAGEVAIDPNEQQCARYRQQIEAESQTRQALARFRDVQPRTRSGTAIEVAANLGALEEIPLAHEAGAMGVGLFRTELLFMHRSGLPDEDEQAEAYRQLADAFAPMPVVVRTLDVGGDKPLAGIDFPREENPFLGWRGVRMCLDRPDVFKPQLRALLRAAVAGNLKVMVPMISDVQEVRRVKLLISECAAELEREGVPHDRFDLGIMIETPAAVLQADALAAEVGFFSIGTNDLTQYVMAADRANARLSALYRTENPAVMRAIQMACQAAQRAGIWVGVCGEAAANPALVPRFIELGVTELSMSPAAIPGVKKIICGM